MQTSMDGQESRSQKVDAMGTSPQEVGEIRAADKSVSSEIYQDAVFYRELLEFLAETRIDKENPQPILPKTVSLEGSLAGAKEKNPWLDTNGTGAVKYALLLYILMRGNFRADMVESTIENLILTTEAQLASAGLSLEARKKEAESNRIKAMESIFQACVGGFAMMQTFASTASANRQASESKPGETKNLGSDEYDKPLYQLKKDKLEQIKDLKQNHPTVTDATGKTMKNPEIEKRESELAAINEKIDNKENQLIERAHQIRSMIMNNLNAGAAGVSSSLQAKADTERGEAEKSKAIRDSFVEILRKNNDINTGEASDAVAAVKSLLDSLSSFNRASANITPV